MLNILATRSAYRSIGNLVTSAQGSQRPLPSAEFVRVRLPACMSAELCPVACSWDFRLREHHKFVCCRGQHTSVWSLAEHVRFAGLFLWTAGNSVRTTPHLGARLLRRIQSSMFTVPVVFVSSTPPLSNCTSISNTYGPNSWKYSPPFSENTD